MTWSGSGIEKSPGHGGEIRVRRDFSQSDPLIDASWLRIGERLAGGLVIYQITTIDPGFRSSAQSVQASPRDGNRTASGQVSRYPRRRAHFRAGEPAIVGPADVEPGSVEPASVEPANAGPGTSNPAATIKDDPANYNRNDGSGRFTAGRDQ